MKLTKQTLIKIIKEELEAETAESTNPIELEKQLEPMVAAYLGGANNDASYQVIENFITALMELKSNGEQGLEEATDAPKKFSPEWWAEFDKKFNPKSKQDQEAQYDLQKPKDDIATALADKQRGKRSTRYDGPAPLTMTSDDDYKAWKKKNSGSW